MKITKSTAFIFPKKLSAACEKAVRAFEKDFSNAFGENPAADGAGIRFVFDGSIDAPEKFIVYPKNENITLVRCKDDLAFIYALIYLRREYPVSGQDKELCEYTSPSPKARYRAGFADRKTALNFGDNTEEKEAWENVFENFLKNGLNTVVLPNEADNKICIEAALETGLYIMHSPGKPLGAEHFADVYPNLENDYGRYPALFEKLWHEAAERNKGNNIIWTLGVTERDVQVESLSHEECAEKINNIIFGQYKAVRSVADRPVCAVYMNGITAELYKSGHLKLPEGVRTVWQEDGDGGRLYF